MSVKMLTLLVSVSFRSVFLDSVVGNSGLIIMPVIFIANHSACRVKSIC